MAKPLSIYLPDEVKQAGQLRAKLQHSSFSEYVAELIRKDVDPNRGWPEGYFERVIGSWVGEFPEVERPEAQEREEL